MGPLFIIWLLVSGFGGCFIQIMLAYIDEDNLSFSNASFFARCFYWNHVDELNKFGLWLGTIAITAFFLPGSLCLLAVTAIIKLLQAMWKGYVHLFRKRGGKNK